MFILFKTNIILYVYVLEFLHLWAIVKNTAMNMMVQIYLHPFFQLNISTEVELLNHMVTLFLIF